jgi:tetratricopeptide (TPR) repeat protein
MPHAEEDDSIYADVLLRLGSMEWAQGDAAAAWESCSRAHAIFQRLGNGRGIAASLLNLGSSALAMDETEKARGLFEDAIVASRLVARPASLAHAQLGLGELQRHLGEYDAAEATYRLARQAATEAGDSVIAALCTADLGTLALQRGDCEAAKTHIREALSVPHLGATEWLVSLLLPTVAFIELSTGQPERSAVLLGAAEAARQRTSTAVQRADLDVLDTCTERTRSACDPAAFATAWARGRAMTVHDALAFAGQGGLADA